MPAPCTLARWGLIGLLLNGLAGCAVASDLLAMVPEPLVTAIPAAVTLTPFQPVPPTPSLAGRTSPLPPAASPTLAIPPAPRAPLNFWGIDFGNSKQRITLQITPLNAKINRGKPIVISFFPASTCVFGDQHGCVRTFHTENGGDILFLSVHSGVGGEGQPYRHALEGTGIDQAGLPLKQIQANLRALDGAAVVLAQGERVARGLVLAINGRVPANRLESYFSVPIEGALARAAAADPALQPAVNPGGLELVLETCGWKVPEEPWAAGVTSTSASVYLGVIRQGP